MTGPAGDGDEALERHPAHPGQLAQARGRVPDFFIVGAPRCGTTYMWTALRQHPGIFMPARKEPCFTCPDLDTSGPNPDPWFVHSLDEYLSLFAPARAGDLVGEACSINLYSAEAPRRIHELNSRARIIVQLRDPIEHMRSLHAQHVAYGREWLGDPEAALQAEDRPGLLLQYRLLAHFAGPLERYLESFPPGRVHVLLLEDLRRDPQAVVDAVLDFLHLEHAASAPAGPIFEAIRLRRGARFLRPGRALALARPFVPPRWRPRAGRLRRSLLEWGKVPTRPEPLSADVERRLRAEFAPEVTRLSELVGRDLHASWPGYR
jgi:hypothetical protein